MNRLLIKELKRKKKRLVVQIILDGFDSTYLTEAPFISKGIGAGYGRPLTIPTPFGARGTIFSGTLPGENKNFTDLWRDPQKSRLKRFTFLNNISTPLPKPLRTVIRIATRLASGYPCRIPANIPASYLTHFDSPSSSKQFSTFKRQTPPVTLIDHLHSNQVPFQYFGPPYAPFWKKPLSALSKAISSKSEYVCVHVVSPDITGHRFGPKHCNTKKLIRRIDAEIESLCTKITQEHPEAMTLIHSDHGMSEVKTEINFWRKIAQWPLSQGVDFDFFLDSTMARFWILDPKKEKTILELISESFPESSLITSQSLPAHNLLGLDPKFGDLLVAIPEEHIISPCFYQSYPVRGMHGYFHGKSTGLLAWHGVDHPLAHKRNLDLLDIFPTILDLLDIPFPQILAGSSIFNQ